MTPFTVPHFSTWAKRHVLDNEEPWIVEDYFARFLEDVFSGFPVCWLVVPEENAKTTGVAGLGLYVIEHKPSAYVPVAASARDQAEWIYRQAEGFVYRSGRQPKKENGDDTFTPLEGYRRIRCDRMRARIQVFAADDRSGDGIIPGGIAVLDELHRHKSLALYRTWVGKLRKRTAQLIVISTAGEVGSEFEQERMRLRQDATKLDRQGRCFARGEHWIDGRPLAVIHDYGVPEDGDIDDLALVKEANPFSGITMETLREKRAMTASLQHWSRFTCNRAVRAMEAAISEAEWFAQATDDEIPAGVPIAVGLDVAWKYDTTALVPLWVRPDGTRLLGPATILEPPRDGNSLDPALVEIAITDMHERNPIEAVVMDPSKAEQLAEWIEQVTGASIFERIQTNAYATEDFARFTEGLRNRRLWHTGDPGLTRHVLNAVARMLPGGDMRFDRPSSSRMGVERQRELRVIDALTAAAMVNTHVALFEPSSAPMIAWA